MPTAPVLVETTKYGDLEIRTEWFCEPPAPGRKFKVIDQAWSKNGCIRSIFEVELTEKGAA